MKRFFPHLIIPVLCALFVVAVFDACKHQPGTPEGGYPPAVNDIIMTHCVDAGCHNAASYEGADGLRLDSWDRLFDGSSHGAVVIPYDTANSSLLYFINLDSTHGIPVALPTMPLNKSPLTATEFNVIKDWIAAGAPDRNGNIPFGTNPETRQKIYLTEQGCDLLSVIDASRNVIMRNIHIGMLPYSTESPHCVRVSTDGRYAYTCFLEGDYVQKIDTRTDAVVASTRISHGESQWNILHVSDDGTKIIAADFAKGGFKFLDAQTMQLTDSFQAGVFANPHGIAATPAFDTFYVTGQYGNTIYKLFKKNGYMTYKLVTLDGLAPQSKLGTLDPHEILMTPDDSKYFVTCQSSNEVRVMDAHTDQLIANFPVPAFPQEIAVSKVKPYMFVTCMEASPTTSPYTRGCVVVIDYLAMQEVTRIYGDFYQPHGITVDDQNGLIYIASSNQNPNGPAPHHASACAGRNGWYSIYNLYTLQPVNTIRYETSVYPYSADARFK